MMFGIRKVTERLMGLIVVFMTLGMIALSAQTVTLTFTGRGLNNRYVQLNRVEIDNLTKDWQEIIYWPDTTLSMTNVTGVHEYGHEEGFYLSQNTPNPFSGITDVFLNLVEGGKTVLTVYSMNGKKVAQYSGFLPKGGHNFRISLTSSQTYLLKARSGGHLASIKMVNNGSAGNNGIMYTGEGKPIVFTIKSTTDKPFTYGDVMKFVGFGNVNGTVLESSHITQPQYESQTIILFFAAQNPPTVTTDTVINITDTGAVCGGNVTDDGGAPVTARGVCWSTSQNPTVSDNYTIDGTDTGSFSSNITNLTANTTYYVRAYATNSVGTAYGEQKSFTTTCNTVNVSIAGNTAIDYGQSTTLTASGASTYVWSTNATTASITVSPATTTTYTVTGTNNYGCTGTASATVTVNYLIPTVTTNNVSNIQTTSATSGGNVTSDGGASVTARGVCWSTSQNPTVNGSHTTDGAGTGSFTSSITNLTPNTTYYVRAYATNSVGTAYGEQKSFTTTCNTVNVSIAGNTTIDYGQSTTLTASGASTYVWSTNATTASITVSPATTTTYAVTGTNNYGCTGTASATVTVNYLMPTVTTNNVSNIQTTSATCGGNVTLDGGASVTSRGVCWSTSQNPTVNDSHTTDGSGTGSFTSNITNLTPNTTYYVRAYATNSVGTAYGEQKSFTTTCNTVNVSIAGSTAIDYDQNTTLTASGASTYVWSTSATTASITVSPTTTTTYTVTGTGSNGCTGTASVTVVVNNLMPTVTTNNVSNIQTTSATCGGNVTSDGGASVTARGVCWSTSQNPTVSDDHTTDGSGTGSFTSNITSLTPNTTYYVRAYATNSVGTAYGEQKSFTTPCNTVNVSIAGNTSIDYGQSTTLTASGASTYVWSTSATTASITVSPATTTTYAVTGTGSNGCTGTASVTVVVNYLMPTVTTNNVSNIQTTSATCGGNVTSDGGASVTARGVCWSTSQNPTVNGSHTTDGSGTGSFTSNITNLTPNTTYYVRAYATNSAGTAYGEQKSFTTSTSFTCGISTVSDYDGNTYNTVQIGNQCWTKENLRTTHYADGLSIPAGGSNDSYTTDPYYYDDSSSEIALSSRGYLYNWPAVMHGASSSNANPSGVQGVCPNGWHVPSDGEWTQLTDYVGSQSQYLCSNNSTYIAKALASTAGWYSSAFTCAVGNTPGSNNATGFSALPAGCYYTSSGYYGFGDNAFFWSSTESGSSDAYEFYLYYNNALVHSYSGGRKYHGYSVRCLRDDLGSGTVSLPTVTTNNVSNIQTTSATCGGNVTADGGASVTSRGVCWSASQNPMLNDSHTTDGTGTGSFTSSMTYLSPNTTYYVRAYATNSVGTAYGEQKSFTTDDQPCPGAATVTDYDGNTYKTVQIGEQCWMKENLRTTHYADGSSIPAGGSNYSYTDPYYYDYSSSEIALSSRGYLYNWPAVMHGASSSIANPSYVQGICPNGWHVPSDAEWTQLTDYVSSQSAYVCGSNNTYIAKALASTTGWNSGLNTCAVGNRPGNNNATGFSALPAGNYDGSYFYSSGYSADFWSSTEYSGLSAYILNLACGNAIVLSSSSISSSKYYGCSVRCLRDGGGSSPTVVTATSVSNITSTTAISGGIVTSAGSATVTDRGVCWNTSQNPTVSDEHTTDGSGTGSFTSNITNLTPNTTYYVRAYATNSAGTAYGEQKSFTTSCNTVNVSITGNNVISYGQSTTLTASGVSTYVWSTNATTASITVSPATTTTYTVTGTNNYGCTGTASVTVTVNYLMPTVTTNNVSNIQTTSATCGGNVTSDGGASVAARGVCWGTSQNPTVNGSHTTDGSGTGSFTSNMTNLSPNTTYYVRAYATNSAGTAYGSQVSFTTSASTPTVTTNTVSNITATTAISGGNVTSDGSAMVTARGVCWSTSQNPTVSNSHTTDGSGTGSFTSSITGLTAGTTYYVRAYATNSAGTAYGSQVSFTTSANTPNVTTNTVSNITTTSAICGGNVTADGGANVTARGVCWSTSQNPTVNGSHTTDGSGTGSFTSNITNLTPNTTYYVRAYATNSAGTAYGEQKSFTTTSSATGPDGQPCSGAATVTDYDGNTYNTVQIGEQCWMKENLRTTHYADGTAITQASISQYSITTRYYYNPGYAVTYGFLYNWPAAKGYDLSSVSANNQGICPTGWHVPSDAEWIQLTDYVSSQSAYVCGSNNTYIAKALASTTGWNSSTNTCAVGNTPSSNNATGFSALPAGFHDVIHFYSSGYGAYFWSSTGSGDDAWLRSLDYENVYVNRRSNSKSYGYSVRCLRDDFSLPTVVTTTASNIQTTSVTCGGNVTSDGGTSVTARGICWSTSQNPTVNGSHTTNGSGTGSFTSILTGLIAGTTYYVRAYATNSVGTAYGNQVSFTTSSSSSFTCGTSTVIDYDNNVYNTVQIGEQCWMKENMRVTHYADGTAITQASLSQYSTTTRYYYNPGYATAYGYLYNWPAAKGYGLSSVSANNQGICPTGWHLPSDSEWTQLTDYVSSQSQYVCGSDNTIIAKALASTSGWNSSTNTCAVGNTPSSNNATGFSALPAGYYTGTLLTGSGGYAKFWTFTESDGIYAYYRSLNFNDAYVDSYYGNKDKGYSVRCLREVLPTVTTNTVNNITTTTAISGGNVTADGGASVAARGVCWSTSQNPTVNNSHTTNGSGTGNFTSSMTNLTPNTTYYVRAYATNSVGTAYGNQVSFATSYSSPLPFFTCGTSTVSDYDGNIYNTVQIGSQCWMKQNLRTMHYSDGTSISLGGSTISGATTIFGGVAYTTTPYRYYPNNSSGNVSTYGYLYNWPAVMHGSSPSSANPSGVQGICPMGWHVPSDAEWTQLTNYVRSQSQYLCSNSSTYIAKALASTAGWYSSTGTCVVGNTPSSNNATGFSALPAGGPDNDSFGKDVIFGSTTVYDGEKVLGRYLAYSYAGVSSGGDYKSSYYSVRCLRDDLDSDAALLPTMTTFSASNITTTTATCGGNITSDGGASVTARGVCWSTSQFPTVNGSHTTNGSGTGSFTSSLTGLAAGTTYYVRAYATNGAGTAYGIQVSFTTSSSSSFTCGTSTVSDYDGNIYNTVQIGNQCWMKQNLRTMHYADGTPIPFGGSSNSIPTYEDETIPYYYDYSSSSIALSSHGYLYNWPAVMYESPSSSVNPSGVQGICPTGWHLPSDNEWTQLTQYVRSQSQYLCNNNSTYIAKALASSTGWSSSTTTCAVGNNPAANNATGFSALPAGGSYAYFWSSTECSSSYAYTCYLYNDAARVYGDCDYKHSYFSVRCLRDDLGSGTASLPTVTTNTVSNITTTTATCGGNVTANGSASVTARGVCWSTSQNPTVNGSHTTDGSGTGSFTSSLTGLTAGTTYYVRAYATNAYGTNYGLEVCFNTSSIQFVCGTSTVSDCEGHVYNTIPIGNQCWMKENMRATKYADGTSIMQATTYQASNTIRYYYNPGNATNYGYLYNWPAAKGYGLSSVSANNQGICPVGWHLPSNGEWSRLTQYVESKSNYLCSNSSWNIAKALASSTGWSSSTNTCAVGNTPSSNNATGFSALPAGYYTGTLLTGSGGYAKFWTFTESDGIYAYYRSLNFNDAYVDSNYDAKFFGFSVRCIRNGGISVPTVITTSVSNITSTTATSGGDVISDGGSSVTARGVCWSTSQNPTVNGSYTTGGSGTGSFISSLTFLTAGTTYYVRAYATNNVGTAYGNQVTFTTGTPGQPCPGVATVSDYDGNTYNTVQVGQQCWMKENLRTTHYADGTSISLGGSSTTTPYCYFPNNNSSNVSTYGFLYNWPAVMHGSSSSSANPSGVQGICPTGWHVPSDAEWTQLTDYVSGQSAYVCGSDNTYIAKALASTTGWSTNTNTCAVGNNPAANNATGFSAFPASYYNNGFNSLGSGAYFWSSTEASSGYAWHRYLYYNNAYVTRSSRNESYGYSVRCLRDNLGGGTASLPTVTTNTVSNITTTTATCGGNVTANGGASVTARGVCWSTSQNPTVNGSHTTNGSGTGSFTSNITNLTPNTTYYVRAYATNSAGTAYGNQVSFTNSSFTCGTSTVSDYDGNTYNTVQVGQQCWMKENLRTTHYADGTSIPSSDSNTSATIPYYYDDSSSGIALSSRGYLYNWPAVMYDFSSSSANPSGVQGICPTGWHVPRDAEWTQLTDYLSSQSVYVCGSTNTYIAKVLAFTTDWSTSTYTCAVGNNPAANNATGFSALPVGAHYDSGFSGSGNEAIFWSSTEASSGYAWHRYLYYNNAYVTRSSRNESNGYSVRCLRDDLFSGTASLPTVTTNTVSNITTTSATCGGNVTTDGGASVTARGVCWSTSQNPTVNDIHTTDGSVMGSFTSSLTGLTAGTTYYVRAYATNSVGTAYGNQVSFTTSAPFFCGTSTVLDYDGNTYNTVLIGEQCWMKENLRTTHYADGIFISLESSTSTTTPYRYYPNNSSGNVSTYGYLYNWPAVMHGSSPSSANPSGVQGICPIGWHVPSDAEWTQLTNYVSSQSQYVCGSNNTIIAKALASTTGWYSNTYTCAVGNNPATNNATGFSALPVGGFFGGNAQLGYRANFWSSTESSDDAWLRSLYYENGYVNRISNSKSIGYSVRCLRDDLFSGIASLPTVITNIVSHITNTSATCGGNVTSDGGANVTARGVCWSTSQNPTVNGSHTTDGNGTGSFISSLTSLTAETTYYVRAYATNSAGTAYGEQKSFTTSSSSSSSSSFFCGASTVLDNDGNVYNTVLIGEQCWMKENLRTTQYSDGTSISLGSSTYSTTTPYRYYPNNSSSNISTYGYLYNWSAVMNGSSSSSANPSGVQGICPSGWHVPSSAEWTQLTDYVSSQSAFVCGSTNTDIAKALASTTGWITGTGGCGVGSNPVANNATGFSALPAGYYDVTYGYSSLRSHAYFWSCTEASIGSAHIRGLYYVNADVYNGSSFKGHGYSVRCLRDDLGSGTASLPTVTTNTISNITATSAVGGGNVTSDGGATVTARGVCWSTLQNPTVNGSHTTDGTGTGSFTSNITNLTPNTTYYLRAYATNSAGTAYGNQVSFTTSAIAQDGQPCLGAPTVTDYDGNVYNTVQIGQQCWMKQNLRTTHYADGTSIPAGGSNNSNTDPYYYNYSSSEIALSSRGYLYNWSAVMHGASSSIANPSGVQGICPNGWHVPSDSEWTELTQYVGGQSDYLCSNNSTYIAKALASTTGWHSSSNTCAVGNTPSSNNVTGFSALPAGGRISGDFIYSGYEAFFWSSTGNNFTACYRYLYYNSAFVGVSSIYNDMLDGYSVRCLRD